MVFENMGNTVQLPFRQYMTLYMYNNAIIEPILYNYAADGCSKLDYLRKKKRLWVKMRVFPP